MAVTLDENKVRAALQTRLGGGLSAAISGEVNTVLQTYVPRKTDLMQLTDTLDKTIFDTLYRLLGKRLTYRHSDGRVDVIRTNEIAGLTDACMGVLLQSLHATAANFDLIKTYAMQSGSIAAFQLLATSYASYQDEGELALVHRILSERE